MRKEVFSNRSSNSMAESLRSNDSAGFVIVVTVTDDEDGDKDLN